MAVEEPKFEVLAEDGSYQLRRYAPVIVAETRVDGDMDAASGKGFRLIADYIFGNNTLTAAGAESASAKIAMTAPVTLEFSNTTPLPARIYAGEGCAQVLFFESDKDDVCEVSYKDRGGKYQGQVGVTLPKA